MKENMDVPAGKPTKYGAEEKVKIEPPEEINEYNVVYWSRTYKRLESMGHKTEAIRHKAKIFLREGCIDYDKEKKCYICKPLKGYNKSTYEMRPVNNTFDCTCQFHNKVVKKNPELMCSHVLALHLQLKIWNWNKFKKIKEKYSIETIK